jgi:O-antigen/teichoic acid export membrane protein
MGEGQTALSSAPTGARRYVVAAIEQAFWSLLNLGLSLGLARFLEPHQYGAFMFWSNTANVLYSVQAALTLTHVMVLAPGAGTAPHRLETERLMHLVEIVFLAVAGMVILTLTLTLSGPFAVPSAAFYCMAFLGQQYLRTVAFSRGMPVYAAVQSGLVLVAGLGLAALALTVDRRATAGVMLDCLGAAYGAVAVAGAIRLCAPQWPSIRAARLSDYRAYIANSGWIFLGVSSNEVLVRFYAFVVAGWYGPSALAVLSATQIITRPVSLLATSWSMIARADLARQRDAGHWRRFSLEIIISLGGGAVLAVLWTGAVYWLWPEISHYVFGGRYADYAWMAALWGLSSAATFCQVPLNIGLQVLKAFRPLAIANAIASSAAAIGILVIMKLYGLGGAVIGTTIGQALEVGVMAWLLMVFVKRAADGAGG